MGDWIHQTRAWLSGKLSCLELKGCAIHQVRWAGNIHETSQDFFNLLHPRRSSTFWPKKTWRLIPSIAKGAREDKVKPNMARLDNDCGRKTKPCLLQVRFLSRAGCYKHLAVKRESVQKWIKLCHFFDTPLKDAKVGVNCIWTIPTISWLQLPNSHLRKVMIFHFHVW